MRERATVIATAPGFVDVAIDPSPECETCGACPEGAAGKRLLEGVVDDLGAHVGDTVEVETPAAARRRAQILVYVVPVAALVVGYLAGFLLGTWLDIAPDALGAALAVGAGALALVSLKWYERVPGASFGQPKVRDIIARSRDGSPV